MNLSAVPIKVINSLGSFGTGITVTCGMPFVGVDT